MKYNSKLPEGGGERKILTMLREDFEIRFLLLKHMNLPVLEKTLISVTLTESSSNF